MSNKLYIWIGAGSMLVALLGIAFYFVVSPSLMSKTPDKVWKIGAILYDDDIYGEFGSFKKKIEELGHREGADIVYTIKNSKGDKKIAKEQMEELLALDLDIIMPFAGAYRGLGKVEAPFETMIVFSNLGNIQKLGLQGNHFPELNLTGITCGNIEAGARRMEILKEIVPDAKVFGTAMNTEDSGYERSKKIYQDTAESLGVRLVIIEGTDNAEIVRRVQEEFTKESIDGFVLSAALEKKSRQKIAPYFVEEGIPAIAWSHANALKSMTFLASLANDPSDLARQAAVIVSRIMDGTPINDIPVEFPRLLELHINTAIAQKAGLEFPESILLQAEIIETKLPPT